MFAHYQYIPTRQKAGSFSIADLLRGLFVYIFFGRQRWEDLLIRDRPADMCRLDPQNLDVLLGKDKKKQALERRLRELGVSTQEEISRGVISQTVQGFITSDKR